MDTPVFREKILSSPSTFVIGVAGDSGSGKTTFTHAIREMLGDELVATITLDDYHRYDRKERHELGITPLIPEANDLDLLADHIRTLKRGESIQKPVYNHQTGTFDQPIPFRPAKVLVLEGLHTFFTPALRRLIDIAIFVDPDPAVKKLWKLRRDMKKRGYAKDEVLAEMKAREPDYARYIAPQRRFADVVVQVAYSRYGAEASEVRNIYQVAVLQKKLVRQMLEIGLSIDLGELLMLSDRPFLLEYGVSSLDGRALNALTFDGEITHSAIRKLARTLGRQANAEGLRVYCDHSYVTAGEVAGLILAWRILNRWFILDGERDRRE